MERDVFISKAGVNYGAGLTLSSGGFWTSDAMTEGALAVFNEDGSVVDGTAPVAASDLTGDYIYFGMMGKSGLKLSTKVNRSNFKVVKKVYVAPAKAKKCLGSNIAASASGENGNLHLPSTISVGDKYGFYIHDRNKPTEDTSALKHYSLTAIVGDSLTGKTSPNIISKLVALVNADSSSIVVATAYNDGTDNDGIMFEAKTAGHDFDIVIADGLLSGADIVEYKMVNRVYVSGATTNLRANNPGQGTATDAIKAEYESNTRSGDAHSQQMSNYMFTKESDVVASATYTTYSIYSTVAQDNPTSKEGNFKQLVQIFCPSGETGAGKVITVLDEIFALV